LDISRFVAILALSLTTFIQGQTTSEKPEAFKVVSAVPYAEGKNGPLLSDLYLPSGNTTSPAIIFIHGGAWTGGKREWLKKSAEFFAAHGYVGMAVDYDLSPGVRFPVALEECKEAVRWLRAHASEYHVNTRHIAVMGSSAGGELAALVALTGDNPNLEGDGAYKQFSSKVQAGLIYSAPMDFTAFPEKDESILNYLGSSCSAQKTLCAEASPQLQIGTYLPPMFIGHGNADDDVPYSQATGFIAAYKKAHGPVTAFTADGGRHMYSENPRWFLENATAALGVLQAAFRH
jgi:acetyl esterase/lipase